MPVNQANATLVMLTIGFAYFIVAPCSLVGMPAAVAADRAASEPALAASAVLTPPRASSGHDQRMPALPHDLDDLAKAAKHGDVAAMYSLAHYLHHHAAATDDRFSRYAFGWALIAARHGHGEAALMVGRMYRDGAGVAQNHFKARKWLQRALARRASEPHFELARLYADTDFTGYDMARSAVHLQRALAAGEPRACLTAATRQLSQGKPFRAVIREITCAADGGLVEAIELLGDYHLAQPSPLAVARAKARFRQAHRLGSKTAAAKLDTIDKAAP